MKKQSKLMEVLKAHGLADDPQLLGDIIVAKLIDAVEHPEQIMELAQFANSEGGRRLARFAKSQGGRRLARRNKRRRKKPTVDV